MTQGVEQDRPWFRLEEPADGVRGKALRLSGGGAWDVGHLHHIERRLNRSLLPGQPGPVEIDVSAVSEMDTGGALLLDRLIRALETEQVTVTLVGVDGDRQRMLDAVRAARSAEGTDVTGGPPRIGFLEQIGRGAVSIGTETRAMITFLGEISIALAQLVRRPWRLRGKATIHHMEQTGLNALPIVGLLSFLIGVVLAYQGAMQLRQFGADIFVVDLLAVSILREIGVLMTAIIIAGRSGSAFTAQIGTMKINQEVDAMRTIGLDPIAVLVLPRLLALTITLPLLAFFADILGLIGGALMAWAILDINFGQFVDQLRAAVGPTTLMVGLVKAPVFAFVIAMVGCYQGLKVSGSAESVGRLTTQSVVEGIFLVIVLDAVFSIVFSIIGI